MSRRRFHAPRLAFSADGKTLSLNAEETRHVRDVLRLQREDEIYIFDGEGNEYRTRINDLDRDSVSLELIEQVEPASPESSLNLTLGVALLKGEKFDLVVQKATELGVTRMIPLTTVRADVRLRDGDDANRKTERWQRIALESAKQCGRARLMQVESPKSFASLIDQPAAENGWRLMFAERGGFSIADVVTKMEDRPAKIIALVGSEGGWTAEEINQARSNNWQVLTLGGRTLRAETAAIAIAALLQHAFGDFV